MAQMSRTEFKALYRPRKDFVPARDKKRADARRQIEIINELRELGLNPKRDASMLMHRIGNMMQKTLCLFVLSLLPFVLMLWFAAYTDSTLIHSPFK